MSDIQKHYMYDDYSVMNREIKISIHKELAQIIKKQAELENKTVNLLLFERFFEYNI